jgi:hypothetical protein
MTRYIRVIDQDPFCEWQFRMTPPRSVPVVSPRNDYAVRLRASLSCNLNERDVVTFAMRQGHSEFPGADKEANWLPRLRGRSHRTKLRTVIHDRKFDRVAFQDRLEE